MCPENDEQVQSGPESVPVVSAFQSGLMGVRSSAARGVSVLSNSSDVVKPPREVQTAPRPPARRFGWSRWGTVPAMNDTLIGKVIDAPRRERPASAFSLKPAAFGRCIRRAGGPDPGQRSEGKQEHVEQQQQRYCSSRWNGGTSSNSTMTLLRRSIQVARYLSSLTGRNQPFVEHPAPP